MAYSKSSSQRVVVPGKELKPTSLSPVLTGPSAPGNPLGKVRVPWAGSVLRLKVSATGTFSRELAWGGSGRRNHEFCAPGASLLLPCLTRSPVAPKLPGSAVPHAAMVTHREGAFSFIYSFVYLFTQCLCVSVPGWWHFARVWSRIPREERACLQSPALQDGRPSREGPSCGASRGHGCVTEEKALHAHPCCLVVKPSSCLRRTGHVLLCNLKDPAKPPASAH